MSLRIECPSCTAYTHRAVPQDPDAGPEDMEETLTLQFDHLRACLVDDCPLVRVAAVGGVSSLLNLFWELIPASTTAWLVSRLTGEVRSFSLSIYRRGSSGWCPRL